MVTRQSVHTSLTHPHFLFFFTFGHSGARMSKNKNGGLDQYRAERFGTLIFARVRKSVGLKGLNDQLDKLGCCIAQ